jgi:hypothetical protein
MTRFEVGHGAAHERIDVDVRLEAECQLVHQCRHSAGIRPFVHDCVQLLVMYVNGGRPVLAGALAQVVREHHVVHAAERRRVHREVGVPRHLRT